MATKVAIIGAGGMAAYHITGFKAAGADVVAIVDKNADAATRTAQKFNIGLTFSSTKELYARVKGLDAVSVITPNSFHYPLALEALAAGRHVFCEKPPALNAKQAGEMAQAAQKKRKTLMFNFNNRARPESMAIMEYIRNGSIGRINSAQATWIRRTGLPNSGWFTNKKLSGGGPIIDLLHMIDLALYFMNYPDPHFVLAQTFGDFIGLEHFKGPWGVPDASGSTSDVETAAHGFVKFKNGQVLSLRNSWAEMNKREEVSVVFQGQKAGGMIRRLFGVDGIDTTSVDTCELYTQEFGRSVDRTIVVQPDEAMGRIRSATNFIRTIEGKERPLNTPDEAVKLMKIIDAVYLSAKTGKPVEIK